MQHSFAVGVGQPDRYVAEHLRRIFRRQCTVLFQQIVERAVFHVFHHVIGRIGIPPNIQQLHDVPIGRKENQLFHLARQQRPIQPATVDVELDRHAPPRIAIQPHPHFTVGSRSKLSLDFVAGCTARRPRALQAQPPSPALLLAILEFRRIGGHVDMVSQDAGACSVRSRHH